MLASCAALVRASRCESEESVGTVMTAALIFLPRKSEAEAARRRRWRAVISDTVTVLGDSDSVSCIEKATEPLCSRGWAEAWHGVGSIDLKLQCPESALELGIGMIVALTLCPSSLESMLRCSCCCVQAGPLLACHDTPPLQCMTVSTGYGGLYTKLSDMICAMLGYFA